MDVSVVDELASCGSQVAIVCPYFDNDTLEDVAELKRAGGDRLTAMLRRGEARSRLYHVAHLPAGTDAPAVLLVGAGSRDEFDGLYLSRVAAAGSRFATRRGYNELAFVRLDNQSPRDVARAVCEGSIRGAYNFHLKRTREVERYPFDRVCMVLSSDSRREAEDGARIGRTVGESVSIARDLVNLPPNELTPTSLGQRAQQLAHEFGFSCSVLDERELRELGMGSFLAVAAGSRQPPRFIVMRYSNGGSLVRLALVGKGLTFDSGGLSLKTAEGMETMKGDMGGGAAVIAGMVAIARLAPENISVTAYVAATENMPDGNAMRPGDVLTALNGETIEVLNTDSEGRLVLADALAYASQQGATHIVDFATLTGGAVVALGHEVTLAAGKPSDWVSEVVQSAATGFERAWQMPLLPEYRRAMDSEVADIKNTGGRPASALTAAAFLSDFVGDVPWAHMDIAGTSWESKSSPYGARGGTGVGVATIVSLVQRLDSRTSTV